MIETSLDRVRSRKCLSVFLFGNRRTLFSFSLSVTHSAFSLLITKNAQKNPIKFAVWSVNFRKKFEWEVCIHFLAALCRVVFLDEERYVLTYINISLSLSLKIFFHRDRRYWTSQFTEESATFRAFKRHGRRASLRGSFTRKSPFYQDEE